MGAQADIPYGKGWFKDEDKIIIFYVRDDDDVEVDITGWSLEWTLKTSATAGFAAITKTVGSGITIVDGEGGQANVTISASDTDDLAPATYHHSLRRTDAGFEQTLASGRAVLRA